jgi:hypothetical protein
MGHNICRFLCSLSVTVCCDSTAVGIAGVWLPVESVLVLLLITLSCMRVNECACALLRPLQPQ